jgi:hypothetical protein
MARRHTNDDDEFDEGEDSRDRNNYRSAFGNYTTGDEDDDSSRSSSARAYIAASNAEYERTRDEQRVREEVRRNDDSVDDSDDDYADSYSSRSLHDEPETFADACDREARMRIDQWQQDSLRVAKEMLAKNPPLPPPPKEPNFLERLWKSLFG